MLTNAEFAQLTGIDSLAHNPEMEEMALFSLDFQCEDGSTHQLWQVRKKTMAEYNAENGADEANWKADEERKRKENLAKYIELAKGGFYEMEEALIHGESITKHAVHVKGEG